MGEYIVVFLIAIVCLVTMSTGQNESKESCRLFEKTNSRYIETKQGNDVPQTSVYCDLTSQESGVKLTFDINRALDAAKKAKVDNNTSVLVVVWFWCRSSIELEFINQGNTANKKILLQLAFSGGCKVWTRNLSVFAEVTDLLTVLLFGQKATWSTASALTNVTQGNNSFSNDLRNFIIIDSLPENIHGLFNDTKNVWPNVALIVIVDTPIKEILEQWKITIPRLQWLSLVECNLTEPPEFPWTNSTLDYDHSYRAELRDIYTYDSTYQIQDNLFPRVLNLTNNNIKDLTSHEFRGFLHYLSLRENGLKAIGPSCFHNLEGIQTIDLGKNNLPSLHQNLFQGLTSLLNIFLESNNLTVIEETLFKGLNRIERIRLDHNNLHSIPDGLFSSLSTLALLNLTGNNISKIEENPFPKGFALQELYLGKNKLSSFPPWIFLLRKIKLIDLSSNQLTFEDLDKALDEYRIPPVDQLENGKSPIVLNLSNNNITTIVDSEGVRKIKRRYFWRAYKIILSGNPLVCDCIMSAVSQEIGKWFPTHSSMRSRFDTWQCYWPLELKNKSILEIGEDQWLRRGTELDNQNCPIECTCRERCSNGIIVVNCAGKNLTEVPSPSSMPQSLIELNLINNQRSSWRQDVFSIAR